MFIQFTDRDKQNIINAHELNGKSSTEWYVVRDSYIKLLRNKLLRELALINIEFVSIYFSYFTLGRFGFWVNFPAYISLVYFSVQVVKRLACLLCCLFIPSCEALSYLNFEVYYILKCCRFLADEAYYLSVREVAGGRRNENIQSVKK